MNHDSANENLLLGIWLSRCRGRLSMTLEDVMIQTQVTTKRLRSLENGTCERGMTMKEVRLLSSLYGVPEGQFLRRLLD